MLALGVAGGEGGPGCPVPEGDPGARAVMPTGQEELLKAERPALSRARRAEVDGLRGSTPYGGGGTSMLPARGPRPGGFRPLVGSRSLAAQEPLACLSPTPLEGLPEHSWGRLHLREWCLLLGL